MLLLVLLFFILAAVVTIGAILVMLFSRRLSGLFRKTYIFGTAATIISTFLTTFHYGYMADPNTEVFGWPIPLAVFQRDSPTAPWLDYVGPISLLAYPMDLLIFLFVPSALVLLRFAMLRKPLKNLIST
jgi:hypothetical protein